MQLKKRVVGFKTIVKAEKEGQRTVKDACAAPRFVSVASLIAVISISDLY